MKFYLPFCVLCLSTIYSCKQPLEIKIYNKTGFDVDSIKIGDNHIDHIKKDDSTTNYFNKIVLQDNLPFDDIEGIIKGKKKNNNRYVYCGTGIKNITKGKLEFDLHIRNTENGYQLFVLTHDTASH